MSSLLSCGAVGCCMVQEQLSRCLINCIGWCDDEKCTHEPMDIQWPNAKASRPEKASALPLLAKGTNKPEVSAFNYLKHVDDDRY